MLALGKGGFNVQPVQVALELLRRRRHLLVPTATDKLKPETKRAVT